MTKIGIILGSTKPGRNGEAVAKWVYNIAKQREDAQFELVDVKDFDLPLYDEPYPAAMQKYTKEHTKKWSKKISEFDGYVFVTAEYNHGIPGALKNAIDFLGKEWYHKPVAIVTVSSGNFGGVNANALLQLLMLRMKAIVVPASFPVPNIAESFNEEGEPTDKLSTYKRADNFTDELFWVISHFKT